MITLFSEEKDGEFFTLSARCPSPADRWAQSRTLARSLLSTPRVTVTPSGKKKKVIKQN